MRLTVPRLPLPGETLIGSDGAWAPGGKGLNQAIVAARCGVPVSFCAPLGHGDARADDIERQLKAAGIDELILPRLPHATDFSLLMVLPTGENSIVSTSACSLALKPAHVERALRDLLSHDVVLLQGNLALDMTACILDISRRQGAASIFNPAPFWPGAEKLISRCSLVIVNRVEAEQLGDAIRDAKAAIVTLGADGCVLMEGGRRRSFPTQSVKAIDSTGCGDAFCGVVAAALVQGLSMDAAIATAQQAAALTATRPGAFVALPSNEELQAILAA